MAVFHTFGDSDCRKLLDNLKLVIADLLSCIVIADAVAEGMNIDSKTASIDIQMILKSSVEHGVCGKSGRERKKSLEENGRSLVNSDSAVFRIQVSSQKHVAVVPHPMGEFVLEFNASKVINLFDFLAFN